MKKLIITTVLSTMLALTASAADKKPADQKTKAGAERTIVGKAVCAKCTLGEGDKCQVVVQTNRKDKEGKPTKVSFYLAESDAAKAFGEVCQGEKLVTVVGKVKKEGEKMVVTATKIEEGNTRKKRAVQN
ncbi:MAG TPA: hypothetical protein DCY13_04690 [Verrucomicrobiales bacterium]|nr:hypothetical protein [Verrucomicrobiales bacterium]